MTDNLEQLIKEAVEKALEGDMDAINNIEDRVTRSKAKAALVKAKREAAKEKPEVSSDESDSTQDSAKIKTSNENIAELIIQQFPEDINKDLSSEGHIQIHPKNWMAIAKYLRDDPACLFDSLQCITGVD